MSVQAMSWVWDHSQAKSGTLLVLLALADHMDADGGGCFTGIDRIAAQTRLSQSQVHRCLAELKKLGELAVEYKRGPAGTNMYTLAPMRPSQFATVAPAAPPTLAPVRGNPRVGGTQAVREPSVEPSVSFAQFWNAYPRKDDKRRADAAYQRAIKRADPAAILAGAIRYRDDPNRTKRFTKLPAGWLNADAWENGPIPADGDQGSVADIAARIEAKEAERERRRSE